MMERMIEHPFKDYRERILARYGIWTSVIPNDNGFHEIYTGIIEMLSSLCQKYYDYETIPEYLIVCVRNYMDSIVGQLDAKIQAYMSMNIFSEELVADNARKAHNLIRGEED